MKQVTIASTIQEFMSFIELLDDAYWEAATLESKDLLYDIISIFSLEMSELNKLSIQDHHYPYEIITEGIRRVVPKIERLDEKKEDIIQRTQTLIDIKELMSNVLSILESQTGHS